VSYIVPLRDRRGFKIDIAGAKVFRDMEHRRAVLMRKRLDQVRQVVASRLPKLRKNPNLALLSTKGQRSSCVLQATDPAMP
jgi:hypothetical protein